MLNFNESPVAMQRYKRRRIVNLVLIGHKVSIICKILTLFFKFNLFLFPNFLKLFNYFQLKKLKNFRQLKFLNF